jgi:hypothetical protein
MRRMLAGLGAALALALSLPIPASEAQDYRPWRNPGSPGIGNLTPPPPVPGVPPVRRLPQVPNYYFDRGGPVVVPQGPVAPGDIANSLRARGFNSIGPVERRGNTSITRAKGPSGEDVQLVIGPNGEIVGVRVLRPGAP